jgi:hypothetical protein
LATIRYDTITKLPRVEAPVLILHSRDDTLVNFKHAERNFAAAKDPKMLREIAGDHNDGPEANLAQYRRAVVDFLALLHRSASTSSSSDHPAGRLDPP